jgi:hypothetical protein
MTATNQNCAHEEISHKLYSETACYSSFLNLSAHFLSKITKIKIHETIILPVVFYGSENLVSHPVTID